MKKSLSIKIISIIMCFTLFFSFMSINTYANPEYLLLAGGAAMVDGPLPIGDLVAAGLLIYVGGTYVVDHWQEIASGVQSMWDFTPWHYSWNWIFKSKIDVNGIPDWEEVDDAEEILDEKNGEVGATYPTGDGMEKGLVFDKDTGEIIGQIHRGQPQYDKKTGKKTGKVYPDHFHDSWREGDKLKTGSKHWWWN